ncbi:AEC family transporter [uncultured Vibrio sp.]|uniref:AEC family transporter n=1 Tax=uncultured Vibrio sp. TaxID=114054 RepID=UPI002AABBFA4|nr:AEC family transporter [uncultured Vibrio sp.]
MAVMDVLLPLAMIVAAGCYTMKIGFFSQGFHADIGKLVLYISLPAVILINLSQLDIKNAIEFNFVLVYTISGISSMGMALAISKQVLKSDWKDACINALGSGMPNSAFVAFPIVLSLFEGQFIEAFLMCILVENLLFIPLCLLLLEISHSAKVSTLEQIKVIAKRISSNPIIVSIVIALSINLLNITLPELIMKSAGWFSNTAVALALFAIGGALGQSFKFEEKRRTALVAVNKLLIFPMVAIGLLTIFPVDDALKPVLIIFSAAPMLTIYPILGSIYHQQKFCVNTLVTTTLASGISLSFVVAMFNS